MENKKIGDKLLIGRAEWIVFPELSIPAIKAKIDTGAKTSSLHALNIKTKWIHHTEIVVFDVYPLQANDSKENRYVIKTRISLAAMTWEIEVTLSDRDPLKYRMLLGREALKGRVLVDPSKSCHQQKFTQKVLHKIYR